MKSYITLKYHQGNARKGKFTQGLKNHNYVYTPTTCTKLTNQNTMRKLCLLQLV